MIQKNSDSAHCTSGHCIPVHLYRYRFSHPARKNFRRQQTVFGLAINFSQACAAAQPAVGGYYGYLATICWGIRGALADEAVIHKEVFGVGEVEMSSAAPTVVES